jgi:hypothetical protein
MYLLSGEGSRFDSGFLHNTTASHLEVRRLCSRQECFFLQGRGSVRHSENWAFLYAARLSRNNRSPLLSSSLSFAYLEPLLFSLLPIYGPARSGNRTTPCGSGSCLFWNEGSGRNVQLSVQWEHAVLESWSIHTSISGNESGVSRPARWRLERSECNSAGGLCQHSIITKPMIPLLPRVSDSFFSGLYPESRRMEVQQHLLYPLCLHNQSKPWLRQT